MSVYRAADVGDDWDAVGEEMTRAFRFAKDAASADRSFVFVVHADDLLGRRGPGNAMVATGLLSAARTAALEGWKKGWTANVVARDDDTGSEQEVEQFAVRLMEEGLVTGEVIRFGPGHIGKALP